MGIPFRSYFGAIVALQLGSLVGVVWLGVNQYQLQRQLWHLQTHWDIPVDPGEEPKKADRLASGGGEPSGGPGPSLGPEAKGNWRDQQTVVGPKSGAIFLTVTQLSGGLAITLIGLLGLGYLLVRRGKTGEESFPLSPKAQRELAQRQLAEVRLKRHVFGRETGAG